ncbi:MAG: type I secretion system permease/ATPase [Magnetococcales bacterium]|nr:type I secretion system permease/ATPase [Magnetococcales bacterium]
MQIPSEETPSWGLPAGEEAWDDPLLHCLALLTRYHGRPRSLHALRAGLPLEENRMTPALFLRAAERAELSARVVRKALKGLTPAMLPAVLLLNGRQAALLTALDVGRGLVRLVLPETGSGEREMALSEVQTLYQGYAIFVAPRLRFESAEEEQGPKKPPRHWFWGTLSRFWPIFGEVVLASLLLNLFTLASPLFVMNVYDRVVPNHALETLWVLAAGVGMVFFFDFLIRTLRGHFLDLAGKKADLLMARFLFERILGARLESRSQSVGASAKLMQEYEGLRDFFTSATMTAFIDLPFLLLFLGVAWILGGNLVLLPLMAIPVVVLTGLLVQWPLNKAVQSSFRESSRKNGLLVETLSGLETIKVLGAEGGMTRRWEELVAINAGTGLKSRFFSALAVNVTLLFQQLVSVGVVIQGVYLISEGAMTTGALVACTILTGRALAPLGQIAGLLVRFHHSRVSLQALNRLVNFPQERPWESSFLHRPKLQGGVRFQDISFTYPQARQPVLRNLNFTIHPGEKVAIIGRTGSGKSTLLKLVAGLYQPTEGSILLDGIDIRQIDPADLRRNLGYVQQDPILFSGTLKENLMMGNPYAEDEDLVRVARLCGVDQLVNQHPLGFDLHIGEQGSGLSGGQRQSVALARAMMGHPVLLLLDEPTSALDSGAEERLRRELGLATTNASLLLVTHKASMLTMVERILVLEGGRLVADGPRDRILKQLVEGKLPLERDGGGA